MEERRATVLAVDDSEDILALVKATLGRDHLVKLAPDGATALRLAFEKPHPDLILLDVEMPEADGYAVCRTLKASPLVAGAPVVFLSGRSDPGNVVQGFEAGAIDYLAKPINRQVLAARVRIHLELAARRNRQEDLIRERTRQLEHTREQLIRRLGRVMEYHETSAVGNRVVRLGYYARALAQAAGAHALMCELIMKAAPLHDIGKVGLPAQLLRKAGSLSAPEREQMQRHPEIGAEIIGEHDDPLLRLARTLALSHHERWDGSGYPAGARGADIPWAGRVMAIVDVFESMTTTQFYREPMSVEAAAGEILAGAGRQFDPVMIEAFSKALPEFRSIHQTYRDQLGDMLNLDFSAGLRPTPRAVPQGNTPIEAGEAQAERAAEAARAQALAEALARLEAERNLPSGETAQQAAPSDEPPREDVTVNAEAGATRTEVGLESRSSPDATLRLAEEQKAEQAASQAQAAHEQARQSAQEQAESDEKLAAAAARRRRAEEYLAWAAQERAAAESRAAEAARARAFEELAAAQAAQARRKAAAEAAEMARQAEASREALREAVRVRAEAELAQAQVENPKTGEAEARLAEEERAEQAALQEQAANEQATLGAKQKAAAEEALTARAAWRRQAEESLARSARERAAAEARAADAAQARAAEEIAASRAAQARREAAAEAAEAARRAAAGYALLREAEETRAAAEDATRPADEEPARAASKEPALVRSERRARVVRVSLAAVLALCTAMLGYFAHGPARSGAEAPASHPISFSAAAQPQLFETTGAPIALRLDSRLHVAPSAQSDRAGAGNKSR
jgi:putative two-component system response regulator